MAVASYTDANGHFPPPYLPDENGKPMHSWRILVLPYIEQDHLFKEYDFSEPWNGPDNRKLAHRMPKTFRSHWKPREGDTTTSILAVVGEETIWSPTRKTTWKDIENSSQTLLLVSNAGAGVHWMEPRDLEFSTLDFSFNSPRGISSRFEDVAFAAMADGSVRTLGPEMFPVEIREFATLERRKRQP